MNWSSTAIAIYVNRALDCTESFTTTAHRHSGLFITHCSSSIASLAEQRHVNQIIMISGDSDFVPAAKHARRSGIDFILDPMWAPITDSLSEHIDGIRECVSKPPKNEDDPLHVNYTGKQDPEDDEEEL